MPESREQRTNCAQRVLSRVLDWFIFNFYSYLAWIYIYYDWSHLAKLINLSFLFILESINLSKFTKCLDSLKMVINLIQQIPRWKDAKQKQAMQNVLYFINYKMIFSIICSVIKTKLCISFQKIILILNFKLLIR
jgi:hypothetical protein